MKKIIIVVFLLMFVSEIYSQEEQYPKHEVNLGMFNVIAYGTFSADYQYIIHEEISVGMELYYGNKSEISYSYDRYASIFARQYFGDKYASGFFLELFVMQSSGYNNYNTSSIKGDDTSKGRYSALSLGLGIGKKWTSKRGFVLSLDMGLGRNLTGTKEYPEFLGKGGISFGYRF